ncbi:hypothetical protein D9M72_556230 [compost metagenome]
MVDCQPGLAGRPRCGVGNHDFLKARHGPCRGPDLLQRNDFPVIHGEDRLDGEHGSPEGRRRSDPAAAAQLLEAGYVEIDFGAGHPVFGEGADFGRRAAVRGRHHCALHTHPQRHAHGLRIDHFHGDAHTGCREPGGVGSAGQRSGDVHGDHRLKAVPQRRKIGLLELAG